MDAHEARTRFRELQEVREGEGTVDAAELDSIWAALGTVRPEEMLGSWKGGEFPTGHPLNGMLAKAGWYGKTFRSAHDVEPLICRDAQGGLYADRALGKGAAGLWAVEFRGETTATMIYDGQPVLDHFKRVDDDTLMGIMNAKGVPPEGPFYYFFLERTPDSPYEVRDGAPRAGQSS